MPPSHSHTAGRVWLPQALSIAMLLWALNPENPYAYYTFLRIVTCVCFCYLAVHAHERSSPHWKWIFVGCAVLYNPIFRVHLNRDYWTFINIVTIVALIVSLFKLPVQSRKQ